MNPLESFIALVFMVAVSFMTFEILTSVAEHRDARFIMAPVEMPTAHLPSKCREYYNVDSAAWCECMGVGPK